MAFRLHAECFINRDIIVYLHADGRWGIRAPGDVLVTILRRFGYITVQTIEVEEGGISLVQIHVTGRRMYNL